MIIQANSLHIPIADKTVQCCVTSPPYYGLRDYGVDGQIGLEETPDEYIDNLVNVFREVKRVMKDDGTLWMNIGDSYAGSGRGGNSDAITGRGKDMSIIDRSKSRKTTRWGGGNVPASSNLKPKDLIGIPWMLAFALRADGWYLRQDIIWNKPNPMPESVTDRCTKNHEYIFLLSKSAQYYYDQMAIQEPVTGNTHSRGKKMAPPKELQNSENGNGHKGWCASTPNKVEKRNKRSVWTVSTRGYSGAHFATYPPKLIEPCILAGSRIDDIILDPFNGSGTTGLVAYQNQRRYIGIELNPEYINLTTKRLTGINVSLCLDKYVSLES